MTSSGTSIFNPSAGECILHAFQQIGIRPAAILQEHMASARMAANLMQSSWSNRGVNLWRVDLQTINLVQGQATYDIPQDTITMLDAYITITNGQSTQNRIILPISRSQYATYPNPAQQGITTVFWFDRLVSPTVTLWLVPDGTSEQTLSYYRVTQIFDVALQGAKTLDMPYRWFDAFVDGLSARLARIWAPDRAVALDALAEKSYNIAAYQDTEQSQWFITPQLDGYFS